MARVEPPPAGGETVAGAQAKADAAQAAAVQRANHMGTQTAATISNFDTQVRTSRLDQMAAPAAPVAMNGQKLTGLAAPTAAGDASTKTYADGVVAAVGLLVGAGVPSSGLGSDGNFYFRTDGGALSHLYVKVTGSWVGLV